MKRRIVAVLLAVLVLVTLAAGCGDTSSGLTKEELAEFYTTGNGDGYSWGYWLTSEDPNGPILWTPPDKVDDVQKFYPNSNIRDMYIPKGYLTEYDVAGAHFPDGTPYNSKQKRDATEAYNLGFYDGFCQGSDDCLHGKPNRSFP